MSACVALLRAVNVGGNAKLPMADLRQLATKLGLEAPKTLLQSGNLVFRTKDRTPGVERALEQAIAERFGVATEVIVRTAAEWSRLVAANPFREAAEDDPAHLVLLALKGNAAPGAEDVLREAISTGERVAVRGDAAYVFYPGGIGTSKLTIAVLERALGRRGTGRNWNTVRKIAAALAAGRVSPA